MEHGRSEHAGASARDPLFDDAFVPDDDEPTLVGQVVEDALGVSPGPPAREQDASGPGPVEPTPAAPTTVPTQPETPAPAQVPPRGGHVDAGRAVLEALAARSEPAEQADPEPAAETAEDSCADTTGDPPGDDPRDTSRIPDPPRSGHVDAGRAVVDALATADPATNGATPATADPTLPPPATPDRAPAATPDPAPEPERHQPVTRPGRAAAPSWSGGLAPDAAHALLAGASSPAPASPEPAPSPPATPDQDAPTPAPDPTPQRPARAAVPPVVDFPPRRGVRRLTGVLLVVSLIATAAAAWTAYLDPRDTTIGVAVALGLLTLVVWAVRAGTAVTRMVVRGGQLEVLRAGGRFVFDLTSRYTPVEVVGEPGRRGWKVLFLRRGMSPFVVDSSMVDPHEFMAVLRHYRPQ